jgi:hypothetical protein
VNIWVDARSKEHKFDAKEIAIGIKELGVKAFTKSVSAFKNLESVTISMPLGPSFEPDDGLVKDFAVANVTLYKRESGDRFHPTLNPIQFQDGYDNRIHTCSTRSVHFRVPIFTTAPTNTLFCNRQVRLAINGGHHHVMREV